MTGYDLYDLFARAAKRDDRRIILAESPPDALVETRHDTELLFLAFFEQLSALASQVLGKPAFQNGMAAPDYPGWFPALWLAYWHHAGDAKYIAVEEDPIPQTPREATHHPGRLRLLVGIREDPTPVEMAERPGQAVRHRGR